MSNSGTLSTLTVLHNHHLYLVLKPFHHLKQKLSINYTVTAPSPQSLGRTNTSPNSVDCLIPGVSLDLNHTIRKLLCLASFTEHNLLRVQPHCSTDSYFIPFYDWTWICHIPLIHSPADAHFGCFHLLWKALVICTSVGLNTCFHLFCASTKKWKFWSGKYF